jgi:hypothetical protein
MFYILFQMLLGSDHFQVHVCTIQNTHAFMALWSRWELCDGGNMGGKEWDKREKIEEEWKQL